MKYSAIRPPGDLEEVSCGKLAPSESLSAHERSRSTESSEPCQCPKTDALPDAKPGDAGRMESSEAAAVLAAARERARALIVGDRETLTALHHPLLRWTTHAGAVLDLDRYIAGNT